LLVQGPDPHRAEIQLRQQLARDPQSYEANHNLGEFYAHRRNYSAAVVYLDRAYRLNPSYYENAYDLALSQLLAGDLPSARRITNKLLAFQDRAELHNLIAAIEEASGDFREAAKEYQTAARMDPSPKNLFDLGTELLKYHGYRQALQIFAYAVTKYPRSAQLRVGLGVAQYSLGSYRDAVETLCQAVDLDPRDTRALDFLGKTYDVAPELSADVTERLKRFARMYPQNAAANYYYALALTNRTLPGNPANKAQAMELLKKAVADAPTFADAHYQLALAYVDAGMDLHAIEELKLSLKLQPRLKSAHYRLAQLYAKRGETTLANREYAAVKSLDAP
jgi:tetratricopeptide (TPR) repeat protein